MFCSFCRDWFALAAVGQVIEGVANVVMVTLFSSFAQLWFPDNQIGTAIGISSLSVSAGNLVGLILPVRLLDDSSVSTTYNETLFNMTSAWVDVTARTIQLIYTPVAVLYIVAFIFLSIYLTDVPHKPPTYAQAAKRAACSAKTVSLKQQFASFLGDSKQLFCNVSFTIDSILVGLLVFSMTCEFIMLSEILQLSGYDNPSTTASNLLVTYAAGRIAGAVIGGKIMDHCKVFKIQVILSCFTSFIFSCLLLTGYLLNSYWLLYLSHAGYGLGVSGATIALYELVTQHTYPTDENFVSYWRTLFYFVCGIILPLLARLSFVETAAGYSSLVFRTVILLLAFIFAFFISSDYKRLNYEKQQSNKSNIETITTTDLYKAT